MKQINVSSISQLINFFKNNGIPKEKEQQYTAYLYIIFSLFALSFFGILAISPTLDTIAHLNKTYSDNQMVEQALQTKLSAMKSLNQQYAQIQGDLPLVDSAVPQSPDIPTLVRKIEIIANDEKVAVGKINVGTVEIYPNNNPTTNTYSFPFQVSVSGNIHDIQQFLFKLISIDRIINISKVTTGTDLSIGSVPSTFIEGRAYFQKLK